MSSVASAAESPIILTASATSNRDHIFCLHAKIALRHEFSHFLIFPLSGADEVLHADGAVFIRRQKCGRECDVSYVPPGDLEAPCQESEVDARIARSSGRPDVFPYP